MAGNHDTCLVEGGDVRKERAVVCLLPYSSFLIVLGQLLAGLT